MTPSPRRSGMPEGWLLLVLLLAGLGGCESCELLTGPEHQVRKVLTDLARTGYSGDGLEASLELAISAVQVKGDTAEIFARVDLEGRYRGTEVSCICIERIALERGPEGWVLDGFPFQRLRGVTDALEARREAFEAQDLARYRTLLGPSYAGSETAREEALARLERLLSGPGEVRQQVKRRVLRVEAREAQVTESFLFEFEEGGERTEKAGRASYLLEPTPDGWRFESGLL